MSIFKSFLLLIMSDLRPQTAKLGGKMPQKPINRQLTEVEGHIYHKIIIPNSF